MTFSASFQPIHNFLSPSLTSSSASVTSMDMFKVSSLSDPAFAGAVASKLYPASMLPTLGEAYFRTQNEMECPRGAVVAFFAQIATIIISIPMISIAKRTAGVSSLLEIDWLHFIEAFMFWSSIHVQCMSFRQSVRAMEKHEPLPKSTLEYSPMVIKVLLLYCSAFVVGLGHYFANPSSWHKVELFGNKKTLLPGEVSFLTWIFHWSMIVDFFVLLRCMWRWGDADCTNNCKWKVYAQLHVPACIINGVVVMNHLRRDRIVALKALHPVLVFISSVATFLGSYAIVKEKGWNVNDSKRKVRWSSILVTAEREGHIKSRDWDMKYTSESIAIGAALAFISSRFTV
mmetsp:Transcript_10334/g.15566  ORF Transcript_10334/g.15566 Transcript_10334/m.15566 type:complete len:344 (+) Transcript_10334:33-1064(+)